MFSNPPLISCIMPTRGRPELAARAIERWEAQTWPYRELVIVDDADAPSFREFAPRDGISLHVPRSRMSIGAKRNLAISRAAGDIIAHFDDDDLYGPDHLTNQMRGITSGAVVVGYYDLRFRDEHGEEWRYRGEKNYAVGASLVYRRTFWQAHRFADKNVGEDNDFVWAAKAEGQLASVPAFDNLIATIHPGNTSRRDLRVKPFEKIQAAQAV